MAEIRETNASVVIVGRLNPLIFQPEWLRQNQIIGAAEAEAARDGAPIEVMHREFVSLNLNSLSVTVEPNRFVVSAPHEPLILAKDFATNCFTILGHTPTSAFGMNFSTTFRLAKTSSWHKFGDRLAPKEPWHDLLATEGDDRVGGLRSLVMERSRRGDERLGYERVTVEPLEGGNGDTKVTFNDHYQFDARNPTPASEIVDILSANWETSAKRAKKIVDALIEQADAL